MANEKKEGPLPPRSDHYIALAKAIEFVKRYQRSSPASEKGGFFWADPVKKLLAQKDVVGLRYYHGVDEKGGYHIVLVGVDKNGKDVVRQVAGGSTPQTKSGGGKVAKTMMAEASGGGGDLLQEHYPCPPWCPTGGPFA
jgi:hypothetical protein